MNKQAQFYLIAAIIVIGVLVGFSTIFNSVISNREDATVDLASEISFEVNNLMDTSVLNSGDIDEAEIEAITDYYAEQNPNTDIIVIYGTETLITFVYYVNSGVRDMVVVYGGAIDFQPVTPTKFISAPKMNNLGEVTITIDNEIVHTFELRTGKVFYVLAKKEKGGEVFISVPKP